MTKRIAWAKGFKRVMLVISGLGLLLVITGILTIVVSQHEVNLNVSYKLHDLGWTVVGIGVLAVGGPWLLFILFEPLSKLVKWIAKGFRDE